MKNFYDSIITNSKLILELVVKSEQQNMQLFLDDNPIYNDRSDHIFYHIKKSIEPFILKLVIEDSNLITNISIDKIEIYPYFYNKTYDIDKTKNTITISITKPFYSWYHQRTNCGWIIYDKSTYL